MLHLSRALDYYLSVHLIVTLFSHDERSVHHHNKIDVQRPLDSSRPPGSPMAKPVDEVLHDEIHPNSILGRCDGRFLTLVGRSSSGNRAAPALTKNGVNIVLTGAANASTMHYCLIGSGENKSWAKILSLESMRNATVARSHRLGLRGPFGGCLAAEPRDESRSIDRNECHTDGDLKPDWAGPKCWD